MQSNLDATRSTANKIPACDVFYHSAFCLCDASQSPCTLWLKFTLSNCSPHRSLVPDILSSLSFSFAPTYTNTTTNTDKQPTNKLYSMAFRKIDIDALEEDAFGEDEIDFQEIGELRPLADVEAQVNSRAQEVRSLLQRYVAYFFFYFLSCFSTVAFCFFFVGMDE